MKQIPKNNFILETQDMSQNKTKLYILKLIFQLYFKVIIRRNEIKLHANCKVYIYIYIYIYNGPMTSSTREKTFHYLYVKTLITVLKS